MQLIDIDIPRVSATFSNMFLLFRREWRFSKALIIPKNLRRWSQSR